MGWVSEGLSTSGSQLAWPARLASMTHLSVNPRVFV
jgi:hypothetical protein